MPKVQELQPTDVNISTPRRSNKIDVLNMQNDEEQKRKPVFLFSVDYILNKAGESNVRDDINKQNTKQYDWLFCTRFKPPKLDSK